MLADEEIWFPTPDAFNDPFDCALTPGSIKTTDDLRAQLFCMIDELYSSEDAETQKRVITERNRSKPIKTVEDHRLLTELEDAKTMGVLSLSEKSNHLLMWSHYADQHKGMCIEFERKDDPDNFLAHVMWRPVQYTDTYPNLHRRLAAWEVNLFTKSQEWSYEAEWRLVAKQGGQLLPFPSPVTGIILGMKMPTERRAKIMEVVQNKRGLRIYEAKRKPGKFALSIEEIGAI